MERVTDREGIACGVSLTWAKFAAARSNRAWLLTRTHGDCQVNVKADLVLPSLLLMLHLASIYMLSCMSAEHSSASQPPNRLLKRKFGRGSDHDHVPIIIPSTDAYIHDIALKKFTGDDFVYNLTALHYSSSFLCE